MAELNDEGDLEGLLFKRQPRPPHRWQPRSFRVRPAPAKFPLQRQRKWPRARRHPPPAAQLDDSSIDYFKPDSLRVVRSRPPVHASRCPPSHPASQAGSIQLSDVLSAEASQYDSAPSKVTGAPPTVRPAADPPPQASGGKDCGFVVRMQDRCFDLWVAPTPASPHLWPLSMGCRPRLRRRGTAGWRRLWSGWPRWRGGTGGRLD